MSIRKTTLWLLFVAIAIAWPGFFGILGESEVMATSPRMPWGIDHSYNIETLSASAATATVRITVEKREQDYGSCDSVIIRITNEQGNAYTGPESWVVPLSKGIPYDSYIDLNVSVNDTCAVTIAVGCNKLIEVTRWFVNNGDTIEVNSVHPAYAHKPAPSGSDLLRNQFAPEKLQKEIEFRLDLRQAFGGQREFAEKSIGYLQPTATPNVYLIRTTIENWCILRGDWGLRLKAVDEDAFDSEFLPPQGELPSDSSGIGDSSKPQGSLDGDPNFRGTGAISLERVTGLTGANTLPINETITYYLRLDNNTGSSIRGMTNGFRIYSPDGADWYGTSGDTLGTLDWKSDNPLPITID